MNTTSPETAELLSAAIAQLQQEPTPEEVLPTQHAIEHARNQLASKQQTGSACQKPSGTSSKT
jgi:hypothetical protein